MVNMMSFKLFLGIFFTFLIAIQCGSSSEDQESDEETTNDTSSLIGTWEEVTNNCPCTIIDFIRVREASGIVVGQHSSDQVIYKDAFEIEGDTDFFSFSAFASDFTNDCTGDRSFNCNGSVDSELMDLSCSDGGSNCSLNLNKL